MILGIDLGTTNSLAAVYRGEQTELIPNGLSETVTPSVVSVDDDDGVIVGRAARERLITEPKRSVATFKRHMGYGREIALEKRAFRPEELSGLVLRQLKADAEHYLGEEVTDAVISVPAYFNDFQRRATRQAGELAGLNVQGIVNEPTAAALAYGLQEAEDESSFLVFDLGGGTFDVSILEWFDSVMEVRSVAGDNFLGGEDFNQVLVDGFYRKTGLTPEALSRHEHERVHALAEQAKRQLNSDAAVRLSLNRDDGTYVWDVTAEDFARLCEPLLTRLRRPIERALRDARMQLNDIDQVVLVGGSTRQHLVQKLVTTIFGQLPLRHINPDEVVARGAAVQAALKAKDRALSDVVLVDVCPYTLGINTSRATGGQRLRDVFAPIIERNTVVPVSREERFWALEDYQTRLQINVYQGESRQVGDNIMLGTLDCRLPAVPARKNPVDVRFTYDVNGLLEVEVHVVASDETYRTVIQQGVNNLSESQVAERLAALAHLKIHPRDKAENRNLLERAKRLYEESIGSEREEVGELFDMFAAALESQDPDTITDVYRTVKAQLDVMDPQR